MQNKWNKWIFTLACLLPFMANAITVGSNYLMIFVPILPSSCTIATGKSNLDVNLGTVTNNTLTTVGQIITPGKSFDISLTGCNSGIIGTVMTFSGATDNDQPSLLALSNPDAADTAKGLAIRLSDKANNVIDINKKMALYPLLPGDNTITFNLAYQVTKVPVTAGNANSVLYLDLTYQ